MRQSPGGGTRRAGGGARGQEPPPCPAADRSGRGRARSRYLPPPRLRGREGGSPPSACPRRSGAGGAAGTRVAPPRWPLRPGRAGGDEARVSERGRDRAGSGCADAGPLGSRLRGQGRGQGARGEARCRGGERTGGGGPRRARPAGPAGADGCSPFSRGGHITSELHPCKY